MGRKFKILQVCSVGFTLKTLMLPMIDALQKEYEVTIVCAEDEISRSLKKQGYAVEYLDIGREINPLKNVKTIINLFRLIRKHNFDVVHVHSPLGGILGRIAARLAGVPIILFTVRGFYFHENTPPLKKKLFTMIEKICGYFSTFLFVQSEEDYHTALEAGIVSESRIKHIGNGINIDRFRESSISEETKTALRKEFGFSEENLIVGIIGRVVREKGYIEWVQAANKIVRAYPMVRFLAIGENLPSDWDGVMSKLNQFVATNDLQGKVVFTGLRYDIPELISIMDIFTLPSYREGMPRSLIEAMSMSKPTVATNIRGCREEVVEGITGFLVPVGDAGNLADRIIRLIQDPELRMVMGKMARERAENEFNEKIVIERQTDIIRQLVREKSTLSRNQRAR